MEARSGLVWSSNGASPQSDEGLVNLFEVVWNDLFEVLWNDLVMSFQVAKRSAISVR